MSGSMKLQGGVRSTADTFVQVFASTKGVACLQAGLHKTP